MGTRCAAGAFQGVYLKVFVGFNVYVGLPWSWVGFQAMNMAVVDLTRPDPRNKADLGFVSRCDEVIVSLFLSPPPC